MAVKFTHRRSTYALIGGALGTLVGFILAFLLGRHREGTLVPLSGILGMSLTLWWGERKRRIPSVDEENRPITLFGNEPPTDSRTHRADS